MFKLIPGNSEVIISLSQELRNIEGGISNLPKVENGFVELSLYGTVFRVKLSWLAQIAHFELFLPGASLKKLLNINFVPNESRFFGNISSQLPVLKRPEVLKVNGTIFRIVPTNPGYAVSAKGVIVEVDTKKPVTVRKWRSLKELSADQYPCVYIYDPDRSMYRYVYVHRLVAMAWIKNPDGHYVHSPIVNHKDGDKGNYNACNLEWCSFQHNSKHMYSTGLRTDSIRCRVRDFDTGKVYNFPSKSQAAEFMGITKGKLGTAFLSIRNGVLYNNRYEFRLGDDTTPWFYENKTEKVKPGRYLITVRKKDESPVQYYDTMDFKKALALWNISGIYEMVRVAKIRYPEIEIDVVDQYGAKATVQALNVETKAVVEAKTLKELAQTLGISKQSLRNCMRSGPDWTVGGYAIRYSIDEKWPEKFKRKDRPRNKPLKSTNLITGETVVFESLRAASRALGIDIGRGVRSFVEDDRVYKGWKFKLME